MTKFIAFVSGKGGVGKTTTTINVGQALASQGKKVILHFILICVFSVKLKLNFTFNELIDSSFVIFFEIYPHSSGISFCVKVFDKKLSNT